MTSCKKFIVFTRGRTGSTAIVDEIDSHQQASCLQEPFIPLSGSKKLMNYIKENGEIDYNGLLQERRFLPFEFWLKQWHTVSLFGKVFYRQGLSVYSTSNLLRKYLGQLIEPEGERLHGKQAAFGFKLLVNHLDNWPELLKIFKEDDYRVIYLERKNVVRQVLSGMVAQQRGLYNQKNFHDSKHSYHIDLDDFEERVKYEVFLVEEEKQQLKSEGFPLLTVAYEDFLSDREAFLKDIMDFLGIDFLLPEKSEYSIMIKDIKGTISNYDDLLVKVGEIGMSHFLES